MKGTDVGIDVGAGDYKRDRSKGKASKSDFGVFGDRHGKFPVRVDLLKDV